MLGTSQWDKSSVPNLCNFTDRSLFHIWCLYLVQTTSKAFFTLVYTFPVCSGLRASCDKSLSVDISTITGKMFNTISQSFTLKCPKAAEHTVDGGCVYFLPWKNVWENFPGQSFAVFVIMRHFFFHNKLIRIVILRWVNQLISQLTINLASQQASAKGRKAFESINNNYFPSVG